MKIHGKKIEGPNVEIIVLPRSNGEDLIFKAQAVLDFSNFEKLCPLPKPPVIMKRGEGKIPNPEDPNYKKSVDQWNDKRIDWMVITSLKATEGLEWEKVKFDNPDSWGLYKSEMQESGLGEYDIRRIINGVMIANSLDERKVEEARKRFLAGPLVEQLDESSHNGEQKNMQSGELVNDSR